MRSCDVAIVGGGPGGSCLAGLLAMRGYEVTLVERLTFPRFKIGESLLPMSCEVFEELGLMDELQARFMRKNGASFHCATSNRERHFSFSEAFDKRFDHAFQVMRAEFDVLLLERARALGVTVLQPCHVKAVAFDNNRAVGLSTVSDRHGEQQLRARYIVDASGRGALLASRTGGRKRIAGLEQSSVFAHYRNGVRQSGERAGHVEILMVPGGWLWVIPFIDGTSSVGAVLHNSWFREQRKMGRNHTEMLTAAIALSPWASRVLADAERISEPQATADFSYRIERTTGDGWLAVGDAAGFIDPLFSSGVHLAIKGAHVACKALDQALRKPAETEMAMARYDDVLTRARGMFLGAVQSTYNGRLGELLFFGEQRQVIRRMITSMLAGDVFHPAEDQPKWVRFMTQMYDGGFDRLANTLPANPLRTQPKQ